MNRQTFESLFPTLREGVPETTQRPSLLYSTEDLDVLRKRSESHPQVVSKTLDEAEQTLSDPDLLVVSEPYYSLRKLNALVAAHMLRPEERYAEKIRELLRRFADTERWVAHVHGAMKCDHSAANTAAAMALAFEALGDDLSPDEEAQITARICERALRPFLQSCEERSEFWAKREHGFNWRIMTCGEAGLAALGLKGVPDREKILEFALEGVTDILDRLPAEGDWEEGPGYWAGTLMLGLRFALALRRLTDGRIDLFEHPAIPATAEFFVHVTLPDGSVFNYGDNSPRIESTCPHLISRETGNAHLAWTARKIGHASVWDLLYDDPGLQSECPTEVPRARVFPTTGIALARSDWSEGATFVALKSGPVNVGHSHLDVQSFVLSKGGTPLIIDPGIWPYCHFSGFFDVTGRRWDFDANASIAHNTVMVGGRGQVFGEESTGRFVASQVGGDLACFVSEAASLYPGRLTSFRRWLMFVPPGVVVVYDDLKARQPEYWEWLLHHSGHFSGDRATHQIENDGIRLSFTRLLPTPETPWRNTQEIRTSYYEDSNALADVERTIQVRRFGPLFPSEEVEFLWVFEVGASERTPWAVERPSDSRILLSGGEHGSALALEIDREALTCTLRS